MLTRVANLGPFEAAPVATAVAATHGNADAIFNEQAVEEMLHDQLHVAVENSSSGDLCSPSTPIRREDSLPARGQEEQAAAEGLFAAMYEQTNVLLRNLHFERLNRRASAT